MPELTTDRLLLRPWAPDDVDFAFDMYSRWDVQRYIGSAPQVMTERDEAVDRVERLRGFDHPVHGYWVVERCDTHRPVGTILLKPIPPSSGHATDDVEIGWHFHPDAWGHGFANESAARVLEHAWHGGLGRVVAVTHADNVASQAVARRIGMTYLGRSDAYYDTGCELFEIGAPTR